MQIKKIDVGDAVEVSMLSGQLGYQLSAEKTAQQIAAIAESTNDIAYIAIDNDKAAGWIHVFYGLLLECGPYCEIGGLVVDENYRGKGVGKMLIDHIIPWCKDKGCDSLKVHSNIIRLEAHQFYEHLGFREIKAQKFFGLPL